MFGRDDKFVLVPESGFDLGNFSLFFVRSFSFISLESLDYTVLNKIWCFFKELPEPFLFLGNSAKIFGPTGEIALKLRSEIVKGSKFFRN